MLGVVKPLRTETTNGSKIQGRGGSQLVCGHYERPGVLQSVSAQCVDAADVDLPAALWNLIGLGENLRESVAFYDQPEIWIRRGKRQFEPGARSCDRKLVRLAVN